MFYVYFYQDPRTYEYFYIGKGKYKRLYAHLYEAEKHIVHPKNAKIQKLWSLNLEPIIKIIDFFENENDAYEFESFLIEEIGSKFINTINDGSLCNLCEGGEGGVGKNRNKLSQLHKDAISKSTINVPKSKTHIKNMKMYQSNIPQSHKDAISKSRKGMKFTQSHKDAISRSHKGKILTKETKQAMSLAKTNTIVIYDKLNDKNKTVSVDEFYDNDDYTTVHTGKEKSSIWKDNISASLKGKHYPSKIIYIFDENNILRYKSTASFAKFCKDNDLPYRLFCNSYRKNAHIKIKNIKYYKWYAKSYL